MQLFRLKNQNIFLLNFFYQLWILSLLLCQTDRQEDKTVERLNFEKKSEKMSESNFQARKDENFNDCATIASSVSSNNSFRQRLREKFVFSNSNSHEIGQKAMEMKIENVDVREIVRQYGAPVYVYSMKILRESIQEIKRLSPVTRYAMKACSNAHILKEMLNNGIKIDAVSIQEVKRAHKAGFPLEDICYTSDVFFSKGDAEFFIDNKIFCVHGGLSPSIKTLDEIRSIDRK